MTPEERFAADNQRLHDMIYPENKRQWACLIVLAGVMVGAGYTPFAAFAIPAGFTAGIIFARILRAHPGWLR